MTDLSRPALWLSPNGELYKAALWWDGRTMILFFESMGREWVWTMDQSHLWSWWSELDDGFILEQDKGEL
jgi:hypothetical protein